MNYADRKKGRSHHWEELHNCKKAFLKKLLTKREQEALLPGIFLIILLPLEILQRLSNLFRLEIIFFVYKINA